MKDVVNAEHQFLKSPNKTFLLLSLPVLVSMIAEPLTGLIDTAFIARLGTESMASLGVGSVLLSSIFWVFNFLGVGSQTEVGQALGRKESGRASEIGYLAILIGLILGIVIIGVIWWLAAYLVSFMGAEGTVKDLGVTYVKIRLLGAPAILVTTASFGIMRGFQDMRTPLWIAVLINVLNIILDAALIFGLGPFPVMGIAGAALASAISQWAGALAAIFYVFRELAFPRRLLRSDFTRLFQIGGNMFIRTGLLLFYLMMTTRTATRINAEAGAAHQAIRQFWTFTALFLDAFSVTAQSLIAYFIGQKNLMAARKVATVICTWALITGCALTVVMVGGQKLFILLLVPAEAIGVFTVAWLIASFSQPVNSIAFVTDGLHWGTGDFGYLRNGMIVATGVGLLGIFIFEYLNIRNLPLLWLITVVWVAIRSIAGIIRVWPGIGDSPWK